MWKTIYQAVLLVSYLRFVYGMKTVCEPVASDYYCKITNLTEAEIEHTLIPFESSIPIEKIVLIKMITQENEPGIDRIPVEIFSMFPRLECLIIQSEIKEILPEDFISAPEMDIELYLSSNKITRLRLGTFLMVKLSLLDLSRNKIEKIDDYTFANQSFMQFLQFQNNNLGKIKQNTFSGLQKLFSLNLNNNQIDTIEEGAFHLASLRVLRLQGNKIKFLTANMFDTAISLYKLDIDLNETDCEKLKELHLYIKIDLPIC